MTSISVQLENHSSSMRLGHLSIDVHDPDAVYVDFRRVEDSQVDHLSLTPMEARAIAAVLVAQATEAERR